MLPRYEAASPEDLEKAASDPPLVFKLDAVSGRARASTVRLPHGEVYTPVFMPVGTQGTIKGMSSEDMKALGCKILLGNTFHLANRPTCDLLERFGGLHKFMHPRAFMSSEDMPLMVPCVPTGMKTGVYTSPC